MSGGPQTISEADLRARAAALAHVPPAEINYVESAGRLIVTAGGAHYGIDAAAVQEVMRARHLTPVPMAPPFVAGAINLRGEIVAALHLSRILGASPGSPVFAVIVRHGGVAAALLVDTVEELDFRGHSAATAINVTDILRSVAG